MREGKDITLIGLSYMSIECMRAAEYLKERGISAEVIDPVWLAPLDIDSIINSVKKTENLLIVDNDWLPFGASAEIIAQVQLALQKSSKLCKFDRLGYAFSTCPTTPSLEKGFYPSARTIASKAFALLNESEWIPDEKPELEEREFKGPF